MRKMSDETVTGQRDAAMTRATSQGRAPHKCVTPPEPQTTGRLSSQQLVLKARRMNRSIQGHARSPRRPQVNQTLTREPVSKLNPKVHRYVFALLRPSDIKIYDR